MAKVCARLATMRGGRFGIACVVAFAVVACTQAKDDSGGASDVDGGTACQLACVEAIDCCGGDGCGGMFPEFPFNFECANGVCAFPGCSTDAECMAAFGAASICEVDVATCRDECQTDDDCDASKGLTCSYALADGRKACGLEACTDRSQCPEGKGWDCVDGKCTYTQCVVDEDCSAGGRCEASACVCDDDDPCDSNFACAPRPD